MYTNILKSASILTTDLRRCHRILWKSSGRFCRCQATFPANPEKRFHHQFGRFRSTAMSCDDAANTRRNGERSLATWGFSGELQSGRWSPSGVRLRIDPLDNGHRTWPLPAYNLSDKRHIENDRNRCGTWFHMGAGLPSGFSNFHFPDTWTSWSGFYE